MKIGKRSLSLILAITMACSLFTGTLLTAFAEGEDGIPSGDPGVVVTDPGTGDPGTGDPGTGDPGTGDPGTGDPGTGDPGTGDPSTGDPGTGDPGTGDPGTENPGIENSVPDPNAIQPNAMMTMQQFGIMSAGTSEVTIDVSTLGGSDADNSSDVATDSQWRYIDTTKVLFLDTADGNYKLTGTNTALEVNVQGNGAIVTLNGVNITAPIGYTPLSVVNCTITLAGANTLTGNAHTAVKTNSTGISFTINGSGSLTATTPGTHAISISEDVNMSIAGTASVTATASGGSEGMMCYGDNTISVASGASLSATGYHGIAVNAGDLTLDNSGTVAATGNTGSGIYANAAATLTLSGTGTVTAAGAARAINTSNNILMDDDITLTMTNNSGSSEVHTFERSNAGSAYVWKLTNATTTGDPDDASIPVTVAAGATGTVARKAPGSSDTVINVEELIADIPVGTYTNWSYDHIARTVTITGNVSAVGTEASAASTLKLDIPAGVTAEWEANYSGTAADLISVVGAGAFEVTGGTINRINTGIGTVINALGIGTSVTVSGGTVSATNGYSINATNTNAALTVSGGTVSNTNGIAIRTVTSSATVMVNGGTVEATGTGKAIEAAGDVTVSGGTVRTTHATGNTAITAGNVTVNGGTVSASGSFATIIASGTAAVSGTTTEVRNTGTGGGVAINASGVTVSGPAAVVSSAAGNAIYSSGDVTVNGGTVSAGGGFATIVAGTFNISGGTVSANSTSYAVNASQDVTVSGGEVKNTGTGGGIQGATFATDSITVSGGKVTSAGTYTIRSTGSVTVSGAGTVVENAGTGEAINTSGNVTLTGGTVSASGTAAAIDAAGNVTVSGGSVGNTGTGTAIYADGASSIVKIEGGMVSASGNAATINTAGSVAVSGTITGTMVTNTSAGRAISATGNVTVSGGTVSASGTVATIDAAGNVAVSGTGKIENTGTGTAIVTDDDATVSGGTVSASGAAATISAAGNVAVSGTGKVENTGTGTAINAAGNVTVSGGTVSSNSGTTIYAPGPSSTVTISYTGTGTSTVVRNEGTGIAIHVTGVTSTVKVEGGTVSSATGKAITADGATPTVNVSGGTVTSASGSATISTEGDVNVSGGSVDNTGGGYAIDVGAGGFGTGAVTLSGGTVKGYDNVAAIYCNLGDVTLSGGYIVAYVINTPNQIKNGAAPAAELYPVAITGLPNGTYGNPVADTSGFVMDSGKGATTGYNQAWMPAAASREYTVTLGGATYKATGEITAAGGTLAFVKTGGGGGSGDRDSYDSDQTSFWSGVEQQILAADDGATINVNARAYDNMPAYVYDALRGKNVTLLITWSGGANILLGGRNLPASGPGRIYYLLSDLARMGGGLSGNPETGGIFAMPSLPVTPVPFAAPEAPEAAAEAAVLAPPAAITEGETLAPAPASKGVGGVMAIAALALAAGGGVWVFSRKKQDTAEEI